MVPGYPTSTSFSRVDGWSTDPRVLGRHRYIIIQDVYWVELLKQRRLYLIFVKIWIPINGTQQCGIGLPEIHTNSVG